MGKALIVYFSRKGNNYVSGSIKNLAKGNTEVVAEMIQNLTSGYLFEIEPVTAYSTDYHQCTLEAKRDLNLDARPTFKNPLISIEGYDTIYLGYPNYWGTMPMHVFTFLESYDFKDKIIKPFCTHEGSGMGHSEQDIKRVCPHSIVEKGLAIVGSKAAHSEAAIRNWL